MRLLRLLILVLSFIAVSGCSLLQGGKLLAPEHFGLTPVAPGLYIEAGADAGAHLQLRESMAKAESAIRIAYGSAASRPTVSACVTEGCYEAFGGGRGSLAKVYGKRILLSPRALNWHLVAHEWSHVEMSTRLTFFAWKHMPQWFDEGVAVAVSEAPEHSESHWEFLVATDVPRPTRQELHRLKSLRQWLDAVHLYGEDQNAQRKAKGEPELRPVYTAAGHELRPWLAKMGSAGLLDFIARLNAAEDFESAYRSTSNAIQREAPHSSP